ncbi:endonuclease domain-containing protein [Krasilnikovia cinnamomea]|uniref:endonuclease domain-containing protein n=1 Tax=Krasilnikovia cinnamomea TaxID=349313 RepID=UPI001F5ECAC2|nr:endonuclease domain-containing protein [Krasilnikovia cinnamomea]
MRGNGGGGGPRRDADLLEWIGFEQCGVLTVAQAVAAAGRGVVRGHLRLGRWRRICRGVLLTENGRLGWDQQLWVAVLAAGPGALLGGVTAATLGGVRGLRAGPVDVLIPAHRTVTRRLTGLPLDMPGVRVHRSTLLTPGTRLGRPPRTTVARAVVDAASWARTDDEARVVLAAACQQRRVLPSQLHEVVAAHPRSPRRALIRATISDLDGGAQALSELDFVALCRRYGLPSPDLQQHRTDARGRHRYLDAYWRQWRLHVEVDGAHHMDVRHWAADMLRQNEVWISGDRILRFPSWLLRGRPDEVAAQIRAALTAAGWREPPS